LFTKADIDGVILQTAAFGASAACLPDAAFLAFFGLSRNGPSLTLFMRSPFIPLTGSDPYSHMGHGLNPSLSTQGAGFSGSSFLPPSSFGGGLSAFGFLYFQNPDPLKFSYG
jgi:hypothetical protein